MRMFRLFPDKRSNKSFGPCYLFGNWVLIDLQLMLPVQRLESVEHYRDSRVEF